jgi:hypothetical protein
MTVSRVSDSNMDASLPTALEDLACRAQVGAGRVGDEGCGAGRSRLNGDPGARVDAGIGGGAATVMRRDWAAATCLGADRIGNGTYPSRGIGGCWVEGGQDDAALRFAMLSRLCGALRVSGGKRDGQ